MNRRSFTYASVMEFTLMCTPPELGNAISLLIIFVMNACIRIWLWDTSFLVIMTFFYKKLEQTFIIPRFDYFKGIIIICSNVSHKHQNIFMLSREHRWGLHVIRFDPHRAHTPKWQGAVPSQWQTFVYIIVKNIFNI